MQKMTIDEETLVHTLQSLDEYIDIIFEHEEQFCSAFCMGTDLDALISVWFNSRSVKAYWVLLDGTHLTTSIPINDFLVWLKTVVVVK